MTCPDTDDEASHNKNDRQFRQPTPPERTNPYEDLHDAITTLPSRIQTNIPRSVQTQVSTFWGPKDTFTRLISSNTCSVKKSIAPDE